MFGKKLRYHKIMYEKKDLQIGDHVGIGYYIDSCLNCEYCNNSKESNCIYGVTRTSGGKIKVRKKTIF